MVAASRARFTEIVSRAAARGEVPDGTPLIPLFADVAPALIHHRVLLTGDPVDEAVRADLVDHVLLPILNPGPAEDSA